MKEISIARDFEFFKIWKLLLLRSWLLWNEWQNSLYVLEIKHKNRWKWLFDLTQEHLLIWVKWTSRVKQDQHKTNYPFPVIRVKIFVIRVIKAHDSNHIETLIRINLDISKQENLKNYVIQFMCKVWFESNWAMANKICVIQIMYNFWFKS